MKTTGIINIFILIAFSGYLARAQSNVYVIAGGGSSLGDGGPATAASVGGTQGICFFQGNLFIMDVLHHRVRKVDASGIITTVVGNGSGGYSGDGGPATAASIAGYGLSCDQFGNIFIGDWGNNRVRKVNTSTGIITTVAGNGSGTTSGDGGAATAAGINSPIAACTDIQNNIYISEYGGSRIRKVDAVSGIISTIGSGANISNPVQLVVDAGGNVFIADQAGWVTKVDPLGVISKVAGGGSGTASGVVATSTSLSGPEGVAIDCSGNIFIADNDNELIRKVDASGIITNIAGGGSATVTVAGVPALSAGFHNQLICFDNLQNLYVTDDEQNFVYKISNSSLPPDAGTISGPSSVCSGGSIIMTDPVPGGSWSISPSDIASVSSSGVVSGVSIGDAMLSYTVKNSCGSFTTSKSIIVNADTPQYYNHDTDVCAGNFYTLSVPTGFSSYSWSNGDNSPSTSVRSGGLYICKAYSSCSFRSDTFRVSVVPDCDVGIPSAFSPNGDGINDVLYVRGAGIKTFEFNIYNRFGQIVFTSANQHQGWDGTFKGQPQPVDVYSYTLKVVFANGISYPLHGNITLLR